MLVISEPRFMVPFVPVRQYIIKDTWNTLKRVSNYESITKIKHKLFNLYKL